MIKFFRKIRQSLLTENKFSKYLLYAIGEIVLVVIGILIALSINNWNEETKLRSQEIHILKELRDDLKQSTSDIQGDSIYFQEVKKSNQIIIEHIEAKLPYHDSLNIHFSKLVPFATFSINKTTYENLKNTGFSIISNDSLKKAVSKLYTSDFNLYKELEKRAMIEHYENYAKPMIMTHFKSFFKNQSVQPKDYQDFAENEGNTQIMGFTIFMCTNMIGYQGYLISTIENLVYKIDKEIETYEFQN